MPDYTGVIYILTNPSFPQYVKIGYADDINRRLEQLNRSECIPFAFRVYATYAVSSRLSDLTIHSILDRLNPNLRSVDNFQGRQRVREFYAMEPEEAYALLEAIAEIHGCTDRLRLYPLSEQEQAAEETAQDISNESSQRAANFSFTMCGITTGEVIEYCDDPSTTAIVADDKNVIYQGVKMSLTALAQQLTGKAYAVAGPRYFKYKGEWLNTIRHRNGY